MAGETFGADAPQVNVPDGQGSSFSQDQGSQDENQLSTDQVAALQQRDTHAQTHITTLETENKAMRDKLTTLAEKVDKLGDVDSIMEKLSRAEGNNVDVADVIAQAQSGVLTTLKTDAAVQLQTDNFKNVSDTLVAQYGDKTDEMVQKACSEHNMSLDSMVALAKDNPKAALALCKVENQIAPQASAPSSINSLGLQQQQAPDLSADRVGYDYAVNISESQRIQQFMERMAKGVK